LVVTTSCPDQRNAINASVAAALAEAFAELDQSADLALGTL
jgi:enoyl-CoA hydratase/carnithine racemase